MKSHARVVVIGGGIGGCSALYHLTREGWRDVVLVERDELTSGTTWHSAAQVTNFGGIQVMVGLKSHSIRLYKELADDPEYPINYHHATGGLRLASTQDHLDGYRHFMSLAKGMGVDFELLDPEECKRRHPLITTDNLLGALWDPLDGDIDPAQLCQALARRARLAGAEIYRHTAVTDLTQKPDDSWIVHTEKGDIHCEMIVNAGGYRCNEISAMMGVELPVASMEHQYLLTEPIPEIEALDFRVPLLRCPTNDFYSRQEKHGLLVGFYEQDCKTWGLDGIDPNFTNALCPDDLDRCIDTMEGTFARLPCLQEAGIHTIINGPITYTPDGVPLVGKIPGKRNAWCLTGLRAGLGEGGGHGWLLAQMIVHGEACYDTWALDPRRFTRYANIEYTALKAIEDYQNEFRFHMPHEHRPAGRPMKTTPLTSRLAQLGAEFGVVNGWERALYFKPDPDFREEHSFRFNNSFDVVAAEVKAVQSGVGIMEVSGFNRFEIAGEGVLDWLDGIVCSRVPRKPGKLALTYFLNELGNVKGEATLANLAQERVWFGSAAAAEYHDMDWLHERLPGDGSIRIESLTNRMTILVVAGPRARDLLRKAAPRCDWSKAAFPWLSARPVMIGNAEALAMSVSFSGELAWELHIPNEQLSLAFETLWEAGREFGLKPFGLAATESMRLEKGFRHWKADLITEFNPFESGLQRFVKLDKDFVGKPALEKMMSAGPRRSFVSMVLESETAPAQPGDSILSAGKVVGTVTSASWGHRVGNNIAAGFVGPELASLGTRLEVEVIGEAVGAAVTEPCLYDPDFTRVRA
ncbi:GcvT family protein [Denitrobaculum tricleocarpae]|uniref:FAD-dependent oxidoreductase n=1 Tax=Denitrobaculum tricleocarpae TaxID=2591009 RepID=A0A545U0Q6_9PROT|nr:FAD-dependent oxidoreductase [Denitrobaculum tricleocarpae]TQV83060.1 FAD-dependent oxidoreductase [Denitrobaculum tricleocarpae]